MDLGKKKISHKIQSLGSNLSMLNYKTPLTFDSALKYTLCTTKFILTKFYLFKQIYIYKTTLLLLLTFHATYETSYMQHMYAIIET